MSLSEKDSIGGTKTLFEYDLAGRTSGIAVADLSTQKMKAYESVRYNDGKGTVKSRRISMFTDGNSPELSSEYTYTYGDPAKGEIPGAVYNVSQDGYDLVNYTYDSLGRVSEREVCGLSEKYTYKTNADGTTTPLINSFYDLGDDEHLYTYDKNGNITSIKVKHSTDRDINYFYDKQNRLTGMSDLALDLTEGYSYDLRGNITRRTRSKISDDSSVSPVAITYGYTDSTWGDLLTSYNGQKITYDEIGNPLTYRDGMTMTWKRGRQLASLKKDGSIFNYAYDADGLRTSKTTPYGNVSYFIVNGQYIGEETVVNGERYVIMYLYDDKGSVIGLKVDGELYYFIRNIQGDVTGVCDKFGYIEAMYHYDAWGHLERCTDLLGRDITDAEHIALLNPFRYRRGYMYDTETGLWDAPIM